MIFRILPLLLLAPLSAEESGWKSPFAEGWRVTLEDQAPGEDPEGLVHFENGVIHMYRDVPNGEKVPFGVITTDEKFSDYQLRFEYRWIGKQFEPRAKDLRDAGVIYHVQDASKVWPSGTECQVQEGDTGDLIFIRTGGLTWMRPAGQSAPDGQGEPGLLPENGGIPRFFEPSWPYIGRFEEADSPSGWNRVEIRVEGDEAVHIVNDRIIARIAGMVGEDGQPLTAGRISFQLEAAEIQYRHIRIRELPAARLRAEPRLLSLSAVKGQATRPRSVTITKPADVRIDRVHLSGADAGAFELLDGPGKWGAGKTEATWTIGFHPDHGRGRYSALLELGEPGDGAHVLLQGIALDAFEGGNEPPLQDIVHALGIPLDVGGSQLDLDKDAAAIGEGSTASYFVAAGDGKVRITPLARFSPPGSTPVGIFFRGKDELREVARLAGSGGVADAHQCLFPPLEGGASSIEIDAPDEPFGFYMQGHQYTSFSDPARPSKAGIPHTVRIFPARYVQGRRLEHAWVVGFEEASNGDYQDAVLLVEGIEPAP
ncbi:3-keto-disaccharide hydrolase [Haloferula sargassicola]|uniref:3-keto-alpha-glucoside-1,2-lyase/3-keto-2-hydroxy-glucal hydratase domain-containing protein n=1 Tax=Haloferula sargassicola TaxID=490096 RepID=A0ABP9ULR5_9BACT